MGFLIGWMVVTVVILFIYIGTYVLNIEHIKRNGWHIGMSKFDVFLMVIPFIQVFMFTLATQYLIKAHQNTVERLHGVIVAKFLIFKFVYED